MPPPAKPLGRPMTLQEKLAAARGAAAAAGSGRGCQARRRQDGRREPLRPKPSRPARCRRWERSPIPKTWPRPLARRPPRRPKNSPPGRGSCSAKAAGQIGPGQAQDRSTPTHAASSPAQPPRPRGRVNRRGFFVGSLFVSWGVAWIVLAWVTFTAALSAMTLMCVRFMFPNVLAEPPSTIKVGLPTNYEPEEVSERFKAEWGFWIVRSTRYDGQDIIYALQSVCTHLGCPPNWLAAEQKFKCPCHGSGFYISGINFEGPAPRPLERFKVALADDGQIMVDKSQKFQQELGQWSDPDSFIPA